MPLSWVNNCCYRGGMRISTNTAKTAAALMATPLLAFGLAACGENSNDSSTNEASTVTVTESAADSAGSDSSASASSESASETSDSETSSAAAGSDEAPMIKVGGNEVDNAAFTPVRCQQGEDDGRAQIEYEAGKNDSDNELDIDIYTDDKSLDSLDLELNNEEWEVEDADKANAEVTENNGEYTVKATVTKDGFGNDEKQDIEVTFTCKA